MYSFALNGLLGFIMVITLCFSLGDVASVTETNFSFPFIQIFYDTTRSVAATDATVSLVVVTLFFSVVGEIATSSRQLWSFARDKGLPFSSKIAYVG